MKKLVLAMVLVAGAQDPPPSKVAPPSDAKLYPITKQVRKIYKDRYASRSADVLANLMRTLQSEGSKAEDTSQAYAFLVEARDIAEKLGDIEAAMQIIDVIAGRFAVDAPKMKAEALSNLGRRVRTPQAAVLLARAYSDVIEEAAAAKDFDTAQDLAKKAEYAARAARDVGLAAQLRDRGKELRARATEYRKVVIALEKLEKEPDDKQANLTVGLYRCFIEDNWKAGLPCLTKGADRDVAELATLEQVAPADPQDQEVLADGWRDAAKNQKGALADGFYDRAFHWYEAARAQLAGLNKIRIEKKIDKLDAETPGRSRIHPVLGYRLKRHPPGSVSFNRHWYQLLPEKLTDPEEARKRCREMGGYLACVETDEEHAFVKKLAEGNRVWLGGRSGKDAKWSWMNGEPLTLSLWAAGQPNNGANCAQQLWPGAGWHDIGPTEHDYPAAIICEWEF